MTTEEQNLLITLTDKLDVIFRKKYLTDEGLAGNEATVIFFEALNNKQDKIKALNKKRKELTAKETLTDKEKYVKMEVVERINRLYSNNKRILNAWKGILDGDSLAEKEFNRLMWNELKQRLLRRTTSKNGVRYWYNPSVLSEEMLHTIYVKNLDDLSSKKDFIYEYISKEGIEFGQLFDLSNTEEAFVNLIFAKYCPYEDIGIFTETLGLSESYIQRRLFSKVLKKLTENSPFIDNEDGTVLYDIKRSN